MSVSPALLHGTVACAGGEAFRTSVERILAGWQGRDRTIGIFD
jgi:hypothetical protein